MYNDEPQGTLHGPRVSKSVARPSGNVLGFSIGSCSQAWRPPPPSLHWGTSQVLLQTRDGDPHLCAGARHGCPCRPGVTPGHLLSASWRDQRGWVSTARQRRAHFPVPVKCAASGLVVLVTSSYGFLACFMFLFSTYLTVNPIVLVQSSPRAGVFFF